MSTHAGSHGPPTGTAPPVPTEAHFTLAYDALRSVAARHLGANTPGMTLQPTDLAHEAWLRLAKAGDARRWKDEHHFLATAHLAIRHVLIDHAKAKATGKRRPTGKRERLTWVELFTRGASIDLGELGELLDELERIDERSAHVLSLRYFGGLTLEQCAEQLGTTMHEIRRRSDAARAWLSVRLREQDDHPESDG